ncbi:MAG: nicotinate-nucleotide adenylyltransferase [Candidatus Puniceispirillaceae bacterium]
MAIRAPKWPYQRHNQPRVFHYRYRRHIGLLGGSFNPAHDGHLILSKTTRLRTKCDEIWWLVSPQNPLKSDKDMAEFSQRLAYARKIAAPYPWLKILDLESQSGTRYTYDTIRFLRQRSSKVRYSWIMGTDNLVQFSDWYKARKMAHLLPFVVLARKGSFYAAMASKGRSYFRRNNAISAQKGLTIIRAFHAPQSATILRRQGFWQQQSQRQDIK